MLENSVSKKAIWRVIGKRVLGATHSHSGMPNQDAIGVWPPDSRKGPPLILVIADGHGSKKHTHSDRGSRFAVEIATSVLREFLEDNNRKANLLNIQKLAKEAKDDLPNRIEREWKKRVDEDIRNRLTDGTSSSINSELAIKAVTEGSLPTQGEADPKRFVPYGSTLLAVAVADNFILYIQLGDGDILTVSPTGAVSRLLSKDERLIANETTSLCLPRARDYFRIHLQNIAKSSPNQIPVLILVATDGYANSFQEEAGFLKAGKDYLEAIRLHGLSKVEDWLEEWLKETSQQGSGDDITVGIIKREEKEDKGFIIQQIDETKNNPNEIKNNIKEINTDISETKSNICESRRCLSEDEEGIAGLAEGSEKFNRYVPKLKWGIIGICFLLVVDIGLILLNMLDFQQPAILPEAQYQRNNSADNTSRPVLISTSLGDSKVGSKKSFLLHPARQKM